MRIEKETVVHLLHQNEEFADYFLTHLLTWTARVEADLVDQLFNLSEMRLARALLLLANYRNDSGLAPSPITIIQEILAEMIGTTRSRVNFFMNKFRKLERTCVAQDSLSLKQEVRAERESSIADTATRAAFA